MEKVSVNVNGVGLVMMPVQGGNFIMGANALDTEAWENENPAHSVSLKNYYIGETVVTQALWQSIMGVEPGSADDMPVVGKSWDECQNFIGKLNERTGHHFRLPTEAEWENAASGGNLSGGCKYAGSNDLNEVAWYDQNSGGRVHPVKLKKPNELGLYDMTGNVWEWCSDYYGPYSDLAQNNPTGPSTGSTRVCRGSSCRYYDRSCRVTCRMSLEPKGKDYSGVGFRLAMDENEAVAILEEIRAAQNTPQPDIQPPVNNNNGDEQRYGSYASNHDPGFNRNQSGKPYSAPNPNQNTRPPKVSNGPSETYSGIEPIDGVTYNKSGIGLMVLTIILTCTLVLSGIAVGIDFALFSKVYIKGVKYHKYCKEARTIGAISLVFIAAALFVVSSLFFVDWF